MAIKTKETRGVRNNNPLNIRIGNTWLGEVQHPTDSQFEQFVSIEYGLRAAFCILRRYIRRYQRDTVAKIISTWAPPQENNTQRYIDFVCLKTGLSPDAVINYADVDVMCKLVHAMAVMESAIEIPYEKIHKAYSMA